MNARLHRARAVAAGMLSLTLLATLPLADASAASSPLYEESRIPSTLSEAERHVEIDVAGRRLYEIGRPADGDGMSVVTMDLDTFRRVRTEPIPGAFSGEGGRLSAVDELRHRLFVLYPLPGLPARSPLAIVRDEGRISFGVAAFDGLTGRLAVARQITLVIPGFPRDRGASNRIGFKAMSYHGHNGADVLYLVSELPAGQGQLSVGTHTVFVHEIDVARLLDGSPAPANWSVPLASCGMTMAGEGLQPSAILRRRTSSSPELWVPCRAGALLGLGAQLAQTPGMVRLNWAPGARTAAEFRAEFYPITGDLKSGLVAVDAAAERFFIQSAAFLGENGVWVFDASAAAWLGLIVLPMNTVTTLTVDPVVGRLYAMAAVDVAKSRPFIEAVVASTRGRLADQGRAIRFPTSAGLDLARMVADPVRRRLFGLEAGAVKVIRDAIPAPGAPVLFDPDGNTIDEPESDRTAVNYLGSAASFGTRVRWVGGPRGVERNLNALGDLDIFLGTGSLLPAAPSPGTRDVHFARVRHATLTNEEASARASGAERDAETDADLGNWTTYLKRWGGPDVTGQRWPYETTQCTDFGGPDDDREGSALGVDVACNRGSGTVGGEAVSDLGFAGTGLTFAESHAVGSVRRDKTRGIVAVSTAEVIGIDFAGRAGIGRIASIAETFATGRPKRGKAFGAGSVWRVELENVWITNTAGERVFLCRSECRPEQVGPELNRVLGVRMRVDFPQPDAARRAGTPGGYEALVTAPLARIADDVAVNEEAEIRLEVPAMVVTAFTDGRVASRVVASFAGVAAESHYGIYRLAGLEPAPDPGAPQLGPGPIVPGIPLGPDVPPVPDAAPLPPLIREIVTGFRFMLASPAQSARALGVWLFLAAPIVLLLRRRAVRP